MSRISVLLAQLQAAGISLSVDGDKLNIKSRVSPIPPHWLNELKTHKPALLAFLQGQVAVKAVISNAPANTAIPATSPQQGLWMLTREGLDSAYNVALGFRLEGPLEQQLFRQSVDTVLARHDAFALRFSEHNGTVQQNLVENWQAPLASGTLEQNDINATLDDYARHPFAVICADSSPLYRHGLYRLADNSHIYLFSCHHIIIDGHSLTILFDQISNCYNNQGQPTAPSVAAPGFIDYAYTLQQPLAQKQLSADLHYWQQQLEGAQYHFEFPPNPKKANGATADGAIRQPINKALYHQAVTTAQRLQVSPFSIFYSAYKLLLGKISAQQDFLLGHPVQNRTLPGFEQTLGYFANTVALRTPIEAKLGFDHHVAQVHQANIASLSHQNAPFEQVVAHLNPERVTGLTPLFQCFFALQQDNPPPAFNGIATTNLQRLPLQAKFALSLMVQVRENSTELVWEYSGSHFTSAQVTRLHQRFEILLQQALNQPAQPVATLDYWTKDDHALFERFNHSAAPIDTQTPILSKIEAVMANQANDIAVVQPNGTLWTYRQLDAYARQMGELYQQHGLNKGDTLVMSIGRSGEFLAAQLAALRSQITFAPMSPEMPQERLASVLVNSKAALCLCLPQQMAWQLSCPKATLPKPIIINQAIELPAPESYPPTDLHCPAYLVHTSGSTGVPKGIEVSHQSLNNMVTGLSAQALILPKESTLMIAGESFDLVIMEAWVALANGAKIHIADNQIKADIEQLCHYIAEHQITCAWLPTAYIEFIVTDNRLSACFDHARLISTGGAKLTLPPQTQFEPVLLDLYGPSENTAVSSTRRHQTAATATVADESIGNPVANCTIDIVAPDGSLCAPGIIGEILLKGANLANGYVHRPDLTATSFIGHGQQRYYRSGDLGWINERAELVYVGRNDNQVQIRGFRVELGEIENLLNQQPQTGQVCVLYDQQTSQLRAYVTPELDNVSQQQIIEIVAQKLPFYMVPARLESMAAFPLTRNDKLDTRALLQRLIKGLESISVKQCLSEKQLAIAQMFADFLQQPIADIGADDNFFHMGGHSLLAIRLAANIDDQYQVKLNFQQVFENNTPRMLEALIEQGQSKNTPDSQVSGLLII